MTRLPTTILSLCLLSAAHADVTPELALLDRYAGVYQVSASIVAHVTHGGGQLSAQLTGQPAFALTPTSATHFVASLPNTSVAFDFLGSADMPATAIHLHQVTNGTAIDLNLPRIDSGTAAKIESELAARIRANTASPGTEAALRRLIERREAGLPADEAALTPEVAAAIVQSRPQVQQMMGNLGRMQSIQFQAVGAQGIDAFLVRFERGSVIYRIALDAQGRISALALQPL